jgi:chitodextrinase
MNKVKEGLSTLPKLETLKNRVPFSKSQLLIVAAAFSLMGGYALVKSFAASDPVIAAAGDIACDPYIHNSDGSSNTSSPNPVFKGGLGSKTSCAELSTSNLLSDVDAVLPMGDNQYECGDAVAFQNSYEPSWGRFKSITHPVIGNHEYGRTCHRDNPTPYFDYFGASAGNLGQGWYSYDIGQWHLIALNSECAYGSGSLDPGGCQAGSPQEVWLKNDLQLHRKACVLAYSHEPRFSSGQHGDSQQMADIWNDLVAAHADVYLSAHNHDYERFDPIGYTPQDPADPNSTTTGTPNFQNPNMDPSGIREFVVGTGGANLYDFKPSGATTLTPPLTGEIYRNAKKVGVLKLTLHADSYDWKFVGTDPSLPPLDQGTGSCNVTKSPDTTPPSVSMAAPADGSTVSGNSVNVSANSSDNDGVVGVHFLIDGNNLGAEDTATPYSVAWDSTSFTNGTHTLTAVARDADGNSMTATSVTVTVNNLFPPLDASKPIRAAFYYPRFPETWIINGAHVAYHPTLGYYDSSQQSVVDNHIQELDYAGMNVGIASWYGPNSKAESTRIPLLLARTKALNSQLKWALYYEKESQADPTPEEVEADLDYIKNTYATDPAYAKINGRPVLFVNNSSPNDNSCAIADKWAQIINETGFYVSLKVFTGYKFCHDPPDAWHQYVPGKTSDSQAGFSYEISPGFSRPDEAAPRLARNITQFQQSIASMIASNAPWQLVTTFNKWSEGTSVENAQEWNSGTGHGIYLDALHQALVVNAPTDKTAPAAPTGLSSTSTNSSISLAWSATTDTGSSGVAGYRIYRNGTLLAATTVLSYTNNSLPASTTYSYRISAYDKAGNESDLGPPLSVSTSP